MANLDASRSELNLEWNHGDRVAIPLEFLDEFGNPVDLSGIEFSAAVAHKPNVAGQWPFEVDVTSAAIGIITLYPPTADDVPRSGVWDLRRHVAGSEPLTVLGGLTCAEPSITDVNA